MNILNDLTIQQFVTRLVMMLFVLAVQGALIAKLAKAFHDMRPAREGHLSLNPAAHLSYSGLCMAVLFGRGWMRPIRLTPTPEMHLRLRIAVLILLGCLLPLLLIPLLDLTRPFLQQTLSRTTGYMVLYGVQVFQELTVGTMILSLLPVPGMPAGNLWRALWPEADKKLIRLEPIGLGLMTVLLVLGWLPETDGLLAALRRI
ncbi:MAG: hypothetical protein ACRECW_05115 [Phyllobacterium sp.]